MKKLIKQLQVAFRLTKSEVTILEYYTKLGERFCSSLRTIAKATKVTTKTVQRANDHFLQLGLLSWIRGHGGQGNIAPETPCMPNQYRFDLRGLDRRTECPPKLL